MKIWTKVTGLPTIVRVVRTAKVAFLHSSVRAQKSLRYLLMNTYTAISHAGAQRRETVLAS